MLDVADADKPPLRDFKSPCSVPMGRPMSAAELVRRPLAPDTVARLNICGRRALDNEEDVEPSGGCICWNVSNSARRALSVRRKSIGVEEFRSSMVGMDRPKRR